MGTPASLVPADIVSRIVSIRGQRVLFDYDLAAVYGVTTKRLNQQVNRNIERFPADFVFHLDTQELANLKLQFATSSSRTLMHGGTRKPPRMFTEHGAIMAATVLNSLAPCIRPGVRGHSRPDGSRPAAELRKWGRVLAGAKPERPRRASLRRFRFARSSMERR